MRTAVRFTLAMILAVLLSIPAFCAAEFRGLYVDAFHPGFKTHEQATQMVNAAKGANFNALIVQVRKRGDAYYNSSIEPKAADIAPDYDPLADVIAQAHAAGLEVHAWLSAYQVSHESYNVGPAHICRAHPEWLTTSRDGETTFSKGSIYVDPGVPEVQDQLVSIVGDVLNKYGVDGIHLDSLWYPGKDSGYNPTSVALFNQQSGATGLPADDDETWCQWRREQIANLLERIQAAISSAKPQVKLSASVISESGTIAGKLRMQQWDVWTREGLLDFVVPMLYMSADLLKGYAEEALRWSYGRDVYVGVGAHKIPAALGCKHISDARDAGALGVVVYSYHYVGPNSGSATCTKLDDLASCVFAERAAVPAMPWKQ